MSGASLTEAKRAAIPAASALLLASALTINAAQEPDFGNLKLPSADRKPVPESVDRVETNRAAAVATERSTAKTEASTSAAKPEGAEKEKQPISPFAWAALGASTLAYGFFISQMIRNRETTVLGWIVSAANESLMAVTSVAFGTLSYAVLPIGFAIGSGISMLAAIKWGKKEPLTVTEKCSLGIAVAGWLLYATNIQNPILAAWAGQIGYHAANIAFMENFYKNAGRITVAGQGLFLASAALNLCAVTKFWPLGSEHISPIGIGIGIVLSSAALGLGLLRERRERRNKELP